jgi:N6-adenosine-specific RNA methylase IME4
VTFATVVIDPPWAYGDRLMSGRVRTRGAANHYAVMAYGELRDLRVADVAAADAHLYLWTTNAFMAEALVLMRAWGFHQKTILTWVKPQIGMGHYYRNNTEHVLFGVRGKLRTLRRDTPTAFLAPRGRHSAKPAAFYDLVERMSPGPYLELFARAARPGWTVIGNEIDGRGIDVALHALAG